STEQTEITEQTEDFLAFYPPVPLFPFVPYSLTWLRRCSIARNSAYFCRLIIVSLREGENRIPLFPGKKPILPHPDRADSILCQEVVEALNKSRAILIGLIGIGTAFIFAIPTSQATETKSSAKTVTFNKDVAPIFFKSCAECHRPGESAPFSVLSYKDVRP